MHPILDHAVASLEMGEEGAYFSAEDLDTLQAALRRLRDEEETTAVFVGLVEYLRLLDREGHRAARGSLLPLLLELRDTRPFLHDDRPSRDADVVERGKRPSAFTPPRAPSPRPAGPTMSLLALRTAAR